MKNTIFFKLINSKHNKTKQSTHLNKISVSCKSVCISTFFSQVASFEISESCRTSLESCLYGPVRWIRGPD
jgi:hypothetical protein